MTSWAQNVKYLLHHSHSRLLTQRCSRSVLLWQLRYNANERCWNCDSFQKCISLSIILDEMNEHAFFFTGNSVILLLGGQQRNVSVLSVLSVLCVWEWILNALGCAMLALRDSVLSILKNSRWRASTLTIVKQNERARNRWIAHHKLILRGHKTKIRSYRQTIAFASEFVSPSPARWFSLCFQSNGTTSRVCFKFARN